MIFSPALIAVIFVSGALIRCAGVGGVLLVPALHLLGVLPLHQAIPVAMMSFVITGLIGTLDHSRNGNLPWRLAIPLCVGSMPGAFFGAWFLNQISANILSLFFGLFVLSAGIYALTNQSQKTKQAIWASTISNQLLFGLVCGFGSALTGTGGPMLLVPILLFAGLPVLSVISLAQVIQIPIASMATIGNLLHGEIDFKLGVILALLLGIGAFIGGRVAHRIPVSIIKKTVAVILIFTGLFLIYQTNID
ncbi:MAG: sulfite exporter TauE/SafE family protein [Gammaproteobacteria bacterium]|nr:sulfite exporter TauE/SafE family protein [Gammaproteobacteria bacterium]MCY4219915.1 sulfite exporter TauE/SafE family protein [Gammaproteobacteria bacterium]